MSRPAVFSSQSYAEALATSKSSGKLLVLDATATWCQPCAVMDRVTWADTGVVAWLGEHATAIQIDVDAEKNLASSLGIRSMPTVIAFQGGAEIDRVVGLRKPGELLSWLEGVQRGETNAGQLRRAAGANPQDMQARYLVARALVSSRRFDDATDEYAWLWQHVIEHQPSMVGVRNSYMLGEIERLIQEHPPARARFVKLRDALSADGVAATAMQDEIGDWISLSLTLGDQDRVLEWFDRNAVMRHGRPELEFTLRIRLVPLLIERGRWADISTLFRDPLAALRGSCARLEEIKSRAMPADMAAMRPKMIEAMDRSLRKDASIIVASLFSAGRESEARAVAAEIRRVSPGSETEVALLDAAKRAGVEPP